MFWDKQGQLKSKLEIRPENIRSKEENEKNEVNLKLVIFL